ncbi:MAG: YbaN family protein [Psychrobacter sp.]|nr:YbaN family protein [Psychrobacter sp.]
MPTTDLQKEQPYQSNIKQFSHPALRWVFLVLGFVFFALGIIGVALPVMPTAPFILLAAACWARGSRRFYHWLINHKHFGQYIRDWEDHRAVPRKAKWFACLGMSASTSMLFFTLPDERLWVAWMVAMTCLAVSIYLWRLPDA